MQIQVSTDHNIAGHETLIEQVEAMVTKSLSHFSTHITRVEVHLSDENGDKSGPLDKRCVLEVRLEGRQPTAVTCEAGTVMQAVTGAADKMKRVLQSTLEKGRVQG